MQGTPDVEKLMRRAQMIQNQVAAAREELEARSYTVTVGGGAVTLTMDGRHMVTALEIKPEIIDPEDSEMLADTITGAVNECVRKVDEDSERTMAALSGGAGVPGLG